MFFLLVDPDWFILSIKLVDTLCKGKGSNTYRMIPDNTALKSIAIILKVPVKRASNITMISKHTVK